MSENILHKWPHLMLIVIAGAFVSLVAIFSYRMGAKNHKISIAEPETKVIVVESPKTAPLEDTACAKVSESSQRINQKDEYSKKRMQNEVLETRVPNKTSDTLQKSYPIPYIPRDASPCQTLSLRKEAYEAVAKIEYEKDMANAGANKSLQEIARQKYVLNMSKINDWHNLISMKFQIIRKTDLLNFNEKELAKRKILRKSYDPVVIPK